MKQHFHREIASLKTDIGHLGGLVEESIGKALVSLKNADTKLAKEVRKGDDEIDQLEVDIEERLLKILALYQPVARDLRFIVTVLKVNNELEHMGDLAESIARKTKVVKQNQLESSKMDLFAMGEIVQKMVTMALDAMLTQDSEKAKHLILLDDQVDKFHSQHHRVVAAQIEDKQKLFTHSELDLLSISRSLERIGDIATSIAEDVIYCVDAEIVRHRPID